METLDASMLSKPPPVSTYEVKEHLRFLRAVHVASSRGKGSLLYADGPSLRAAVRAYLRGSQYFRNRTLTPSFSPVLL